MGKMITNETFAGQDQTILNLIDNTVGLAVRQPWPLASVVSNIIWTRHHLDVCPNDGPLPLGSPPRGRKSPFFLQCLSWAGGDLGDFLLGTVSLR